MLPRNFGNWKFERNLGSGAFGRVELWKNSFTNKKIAIKKCMLPKNTITPRQIERWKNEIENMKAFNHPNIVKSEMIPAEMEFDSPVLCMEFCNKGDLRKLLNEPENTCGLIQKDALTVMKDISSALKYLHYQKITHRDLKPENIVLHMKDEHIIYKLIDLGYAKELGNQSTTASFVGTFNYVAPELFYKKKYTRSVDYWSLGILFFEVWTGYKPFIPFNENLRNWIKNMEEKKYKDICAKEVADGIKFFDHIIYPHDISECILGMMIDWFQVVLQWDHRQRGKRPNCEDIVVFPLLKNIFPWKIVNIFSVPTYTNIVYHIRGRSTFTELQKWVEQKTHIPSAEQLIANALGQVYNESVNPDELLSQCEPDSTLYVYKSDSLQVISCDDESKIPEILDLMLINPNEIRDGSLLRQCYTALIFIMRREMMSFRNFVLAIATKFDIISEKFILLHNNVAQALCDVETLYNCIVGSVNMMDLKVDLIGSMRTLHERVDDLHNTLSQIKVNIDNSGSLQSEIKMYLISEKFSQIQQDYRAKYEELLAKFSDFESEKTCTSDYIIQHVAALSDFLGSFEDQKAAMFEESEIAAMARQIEYFGTIVHTSSENINTIMPSISSYNAQYTELFSQMNQSISTTMDSDTDIIPPTTSNPETIPGVNDDIEIRNDIFLRTAFGNYLQEIRHSLQNLSMDDDVWQLP
ncbi:hypothetical protein QAD02_016316 [Eretmocerus hayati]|uniref:Uncharacterized protein n=1 Tax=Eretmocerus hayati TaxID=131215 RepID=A0ACC2PA87_9HYME|nr:hypothetical protein QAD02_016316 [Eretmocerus hayati]